MKALSLIQPWATLVAIGAKCIETRSWYTPWRGAIAIHASKGFPPECRALIHEDPFRLALAQAGIRSQDDLPLGAVVARARILRCIRTEDADPSSTERAFGDFTPGRWAWVLTDVQRMPRPIPARGMLGLWDWSPDGHKPGQLPLLEGRDR